MQAILVRCGCGAKHSKGKPCQACNAQHDQRRGSAHSRGYTYRWSQEAKRYLDQNPLCVACFARGKITPATEVDHIVPHRGDMRQFWRAEGWQALCKPCHSAKTARGE